MRGCLLGASVGAYEGRGRSLQNGIGDRDHRQADYALGWQQVHLVRTGGGESFTFC